MNIKSLYFNIIEFISEIDVRSQRVNSLRSGASGDYEQCIFKDFEIVA